MGILSVIGSFLGCKKTDGDNDPKTNTQINESGLKRFSYSYNGSIGGDSYSYEVKEEDGKYSFSFESMLYSEYGEMTMPVDVSVQEELYKVLKECGVADWDGFSKSDPDVLDGDGFSLHIDFSDGGKLRAGGSNAYPKGYREFREKMQEVLKPFEKQLLEEKRQEKISEGINGKLEGFQVHFHQRGSSGRDSYDFMLFLSDIRETTTEIKIKSESGEFFEPGEYSLYKAVPDEMLPLDKVQDLIDKYKLINWYRYDETAEDYNNAEWFQVDFCFDDGKDIDACGTLHPENYDGFRHDILELMQQFYNEAEKVETP